MTHGKGNRTQILEHSPWHRDLIGFSSVKTQFSVGFLGGSTFNVGARQLTGDVRLHHTHPV